MLTLGADDQNFGFLSELVQRDQRLNVLNVFDKGALELWRL